MPLTSACVIRSPTGSDAPLLVGDLALLAAAGEAFGDLEQPLGGVGAAVEDDVLDALAQFRVDLVVDRRARRR